MTRDWPRMIAKAQTTPTVSFAGLSYPRVPYGKEDPRSAVYPDPCRDCGVAPGQIHVHTHSCCIEECPKCHWQLISCPCTAAEKADA